MTSRDRIERVITNGLNEQQLSQGDLYGTLFREMQRLQREQPGQLNQQVRDFNRLSQHIAGFPTFTVGANGDLHIASVHGAGPRAPEQGERHRPAQHARPAHRAEAPQQAPRAEAVHPTPQRDRSVTVTQPQTQQRELPQSGAQPARPAEQRQPQLHQWFQPGEAPPYVGGA